MIRITETDDFVVDYDKEKGMYRLSTFENNHFQEEYWFDAYEAEELKHIAMPVKRFKNYNHEWWAGRCPNCNEIIEYNYRNGCKEGNRRHYCFKCGQLCDFEDN